MQHARQRLVICEHREWAIQCMFKSPNGEVDGEQLPAICNLSELWTQPLRDEY